MILIALPGIVTTCLLALVLLKLLERQNEERQAHRIEIDQLTTSQRGLVERLIDVHRKEVATLCQRIQAPQLAVAQHMPQDLPSDPHQPDIEDDMALLNQRKRDLDRLQAELQIRAEELATEPDHYGADSVFTP